MKWEEEWENREEGSEEKGRGVRGEEDTCVKRLPHIVCNSHIVYLNGLLPGGCGKADRTTDIPTVLPSNGAHRA